MDDNYHNNYNKVLIIVIFTKTVNSKPQLQQFHWNRFIIVMVLIIITVTDIVIIIVIVIVSIFVLIAVIVIVIIIVIVNVIIMSSYTVCSVWENHTPLTLVLSNG